MGGSLSSRATASDEEVADLVRRAAGGERDAWEMIVDRYVALLWAVALRHGIGQADAADVVQITWVRLLEHIHDIRDPARISAWLATTAQREALRVLALRRRVTLSGDIEAFDGVDRLTAPVDEGLLTRELTKEAKAVVRTLPTPWRELLELLVSDPPPSYEEIGGRLGMPIGSIGPTRGRCLERVRTSLAAS